MEGGGDREAWRGGEGRGGGHLEVSVNDPLRVDVLQHFYHLCRIELSVLQRHLTPLQQAMAQASRDVNASSMSGWRKGCGVMSTHFLDLLEQLPTFAALQAHVWR